MSSMDDAVWECYGCGSLLLSSELEGDIDTFDGDPPQCPECGAYSLKLDTENSGQ
jgi:predicted  nucleic acid-binding Zn-ribbon protein